ncbi:MAG: hypothetical protein WDO69_32615 [Pseudomonadota bacterium]
MGRPKRTTVDQDLALDLLLDHKAEFVRAFLEANDLAVSGAKAELRDRLEDALAKGTVIVGDIIARLDEIEGWGNQHVYLYRAPEGILPTWRSESSVKDILRAAKKVSLFNAHIPLALPPATTLSKVDWSPQRVRFVWITTRNWEERLDGKDRREGLRVWKAYEERSARGVLAFDWNLQSGDAMLMIERLPSGNDYEDARTALVKELKPLLDLSVFSTVEVGRGIQPIEKSNEVLNRSLALRSQRGTKVSFTSRSRKRDAFERDPDAQRSRESLGDNVAGDTGNFYWKKAGVLTDDLHTTIYAKDSRVGIFGERTEEEVAHVIQRIRHYCA